MEGFSVLMSVYYKDNFEWFDKALESILINQSVIPSEIVLVEDGLLTHELYLVIEKYKKLFENFISIKLDENLGLGNALNIGLEKCNYNIIARMDADDISKPDRFKIQLFFFQTDRCLDVVGAAIEEFESDPSIIKSIRKLPEKGDALYQFAKRRNPINHPVVMFKKEAVMAVGGYKPFPLFEDYYLWIRMLTNAAKFYNTPDSLLYFRFSYSTYARRAGWSYAITELNFEYQKYKLGMLSWIDLILIVPLKFCIRLSPMFCRILLYKFILR